MSQLLVRRGVFIALMVLWLFPGWAMAQDAVDVPVEFSMVQVVPPGIGWTNLTGFNNSGEVVGSGFGSGTGSGSCNQAFVWSDGAAIDIGAILGACSHANAINDNGRVVGRYSGADGRGRVFFMDFDQVLEMPDPYVGDLSPRGINNAGQSVGLKRAPDQTWNWTAYLMNGDELVDLHPEGAVSSGAYDVNDLGEIVGKVDRGDGGTRGVVWSESGYTEIGDVGDHFAAVAINESSKVALTGRLVGEGISHAYLLDGEDLIDLGHLKEGWTEAADINDSGWIVGKSRAPDGIGEHAFLWSDGVMYDLNDLISDDSPWELIWGVAVNDNLQILVRGNNAETGYHGYLVLTPQSTEGLIDGLIDDVQELIDDGVINYGRGRSLIAELQVALWFLEFRGGERIAVIRIELFILKVERLVRIADLDPEIGAELIRKAEAILEMLRSI